MKIDTELYKARVIDAIYAAKKVTDLKSRVKTINIESPAGIGKTKICGQAVAETNMRGRKNTDDIISKTVFSVVDAQILNNPGDIAGALDIVDGDTVVASRNELFGELLSLKQGEAGVLLIDDIKRLHPQILQELMPLLQDGRVGPGKFLGSNVVIIATSNPDGGGYKGTRLDPAQKSRMVNYILGENIEKWLYWASENNIHDVVLAFLSEFPEMLLDTKKFTVNPRTWEMISDELTCLEDSQTLSPEDMRMMIKAMVFTNLETDHAFFDYYARYTGGDVLTILEIAQLLKRGDAEKIIDILGKYKENKAGVHKVLRLVLIASNKNNVKASHIIKIITCEHVTADMAHVYLALWRKNEELFDALARSKKLKAYIRKVFFGGK